MLFANTHLDKWWLKLFKMLRHCGSLFEKLKMIYPLLLGRIFYCLICIKQGDNYMPDYTSGSKKEMNRIPMVAILLTGSFLAILNQTLLITATPHIMLDFGLTESTGQWVTTIFMLVNGIMIPITAYLMETYTTRRLFLLSMTIFMFGTLICFAAVYFLILMVGRVVHVAVSGIMMLLMMTIFMLIFAVEKRGFAMGMAGLVIAFAPAIGPSLAGWLVDLMHWRFLFLIILPLCTVDLIFAYFYMQDVIERTFPKVDFLSIVLSVLGFGGILFGFSSVGNYGWF